MSLRGRALIALRLHGSLTPTQLAAELGCSYTHTCTLLRELAREGEVAWHAGGAARALSTATKAAKAKAPHDGATVTTPVGYSVRDGLGNELAWFADEATALELWHAVPNAMRLVDTATNKSLRIAGVNAAS